MNLQESMTGHTGILSCRFTCHFMPVGLILDVVLTCRSSRNEFASVTPAHAGFQSFETAEKILDFGFRRNDEIEVLRQIEYCDLRK